ncbi:MAG: VOC family protein [Phycisphaerae bacterium]
MLNEIEQMVEAFERGMLTRRQLMARMGTVIAAIAGVQRVAAASQSTAASPQQAPRLVVGRKPKPAAPTFEALALNHVALSVTDVARSRDFYRRHLGLKVRSESGDRRCFMDCGEHFVALFRDKKPGLDHYCYTIRDYRPSHAVDRLKAAGLNPRRTENRVYFDDPDGLTVQVASKNA